MCLSIVMAGIDFFSLVRDGDFRRFTSSIEVATNDELEVLDSRGNSLLANAVLCEDVKMVKALCRKGIDIHRCDRHCGGEPALMYALDSGNDEIVGELLAHTTDFEILGVVTWMGIPMKERLDEYFETKKSE